MAASESILLRRFTENRDAEAFSEIVKLYADPVYNTCRRILYDEAGAADAAQETFYQLMCNADSVKGSLAGWLHSVATHKAVDAIRRNSSRRIRERRYAFGKSKEVNQWKDISPYIDQELGKLASEHKEILLRYFFEGQTMKEIAELKCVSQPTVSRMISAAIEALRNRLRKKGIIVATMVLAGFIEKNTFYAAPGVLINEVSKMSLVGTTSGMLTSSTVVSSGTAPAAVGSLLSGFSASTALSAAFSTAKAKVMTAVAVTAIGTGTYMVYHHNLPPENPNSHSAEAEIHNAQTASDLEARYSRTNQPMALGGQMSGGGMGGGTAVRGSASSNEGDLQIDFTDPEMTISSFTEWLVSNNPDLWTQCFTQNSQALVNLKRVMTHPRDEREQQLQNAFDSIDEPVEVLEILELKDGLFMKLLYTVYDSFFIDENNERRTWQEGDQFEVNVELINVDNEWRIDTIFTSKALAN